MIIGIIGGTGDGGGYGGFAKPVPPNSTQDSPFGQQHCVNCGVTRQGVGGGGIGGGGGGGGGGGVHVPPQAGGFPLLFNESRTHVFSESPSSGLPPFCAIALRQHSSISL